MFNQPNPFKDEDVIKNLKIIVKSGLIFITLLLISFSGLIFLKYKFDISNYFLGAGIFSSLVISYFFLVNFVIKPNTNND